MGDAQIHDLQHYCPINLVIDTFFRGINLLRSVVKASKHMNKGYFLNKATLRIC